MVRHKSTDFLRWNYTTFVLNGSARKLAKLQGVSKRKKKNPGSFKIFI
jgi:hypothetical protein